MLSEFKKFLLKGNVMDLAVGVIIGGAFSGIVNSLVNDIITPVLSIFTGKVDFSSLSITIPHTSAVIAFGAFLTAIINFVILGFVIFLMVKCVNKLMAFGQKPVEEAITTKKCSFCCSDIPLEATRCPHCTSKLES